MAEAKLYSKRGKLVGRVFLPDDVFGVEPNIPVMHQVVTAQRAAARAGSHSTKRRSEVRGGGSKPWRQKGTGRARAGSIRSPLWVGGGVAHGPKPRDYSQRIPKKMKKLALRSALSDMASREAIIALESWPFDEGPSTKAAVGLFETIGIARHKILTVVGELEDETALSVRNLAWSKPIRADQINTYDVVDAEYIVAEVGLLAKIAGRELEVTKDPVAGDEGEDDEVSGEENDGEDDS